MSLYDEYCSTGHVSEITPQALRETHHWYERQFNSIIPPVKDIQILDLGCGPGYFLSWLVSKGYSNTVGVDSSTKLLAMAKSLEVSIVQDDLVHYLESSTEQFHMITLFHVMEHFPFEEAQYLLKLIHSRLKFGGLFLVAVPNAMSPFPASAYGDISHRLYFSWQSMRQLLILSGFKDITYMPPHPMVAKRNILGRFRQLFRSLYLKKLSLLDGLVNGFGGVRERPLEGQLIASCYKRD